jgi:hypothetical protein
MKQQELLGMPNPHKKVRRLIVGFGSTDKRGASRLTSRSFHPAKPYSRTSTSWASRLDSVNSHVGSWVRARATAAVSPVATLRASVFACLRSDSSDGRAGRARTDEVFEVMGDLLSCSPVTR